MDITFELALSPVITPNYPKPKLIHQVFNYFSQFQAQPYACDYYLPLYSKTQPSNEIFNHALTLYVDRHFTDIGHFIWENRFNTNPYLLQLTDYHVTEIDADAVMGMIQVDPTCSCFHLSHEKINKLLFLPANLAIQHLDRVDNLKKIGVFVTDCNWVGMPIFLLDSASAQQFIQYLTPILSIYNQPINLNNNYWLSSENNKTYTLLYCSNLDQDSTKSTQISKKIRIPHFI